MSVDEGLRATLEQRADALPQVRPDVLALVAAGEAAETGLRRRRRIVLVAAAAAVAAVLVGTWRLGDLAQAPRPAQPADATLAPIPVHAEIVDVGGSPAASLIIDTSGGLLYVGLSSAADTVAVVDAATRTPVATIDLGAPAASGGMALDAPRSLLYVPLADTKDPTVAVVSTATNRVVDTIEVGPDTTDDVRLGDVVVDPDSGSLYVAGSVDAGSGAARGSVTVVDRDSLAVVDRVDVGPTAGELVLDAERYNLFATGPDDEVLVLGPGRTIVDSVPGRGVGCLVSDPPRDLVLGCNPAAGTVTVVDALASSEVVAALDIGAFGPLELAVDSRAGRAYAGDVVIDLETIRVIGRLRPDLPGSPTLESIAVDPTTGTTYALARRPGSVDLVALDPATP